jgi:hypothetical protein
MANIDLNIFLLIIIGIFGWLLGVCRTNLKRALKTNNRAEIMIFERDEEITSLKSKLDASRTLIETVFGAPVVMHIMPTGGSFEQFEIMFQDDKNEIIFRRTFGIHSVKEPLNPYDRLCEIIHWVKKYGEEAQKTFQVMKENEIASRKGGSGSG